MPVLVQDHLGVLGIVDASLAEAHLVLGMIGGKRVVLAPLVDAHGLLIGVDGRPTGGHAKAQRAQIQLGLGDPVVGHDLLEAVVMAGVIEGAVGFIGLVARARRH